MDFDDDETGGIEGAIIRLDTHIMALQGLQQLLKLMDNVRVPGGTVGVGCVSNLLQVLIRDIDRCRDEIEIARQRREAA